MIKASVEKGVPFDLVLQLLFYFTGWNLGLTLSISALTSIIIVIGQLNDQSEITAMRAGGITFFSMFRPFFIIGFFLTVLLSLQTQILLPYCFRNMSKLIEKIYNYNPISLLETGQFLTLSNTNKSRRSIFIEKKEVIDDQEVFKNIQIKKINYYPGYTKVAQLIIAKKGIQIQKKGADQKMARFLRLYNGYALSREKNENEFQKIDFINGTFDVHIMNSEKFKDQIKRSGIQGMSNDDLLRNYNDLMQQGKDISSALQYLIEYHKRIALSFSAFIFLFLGFSAAIVNQRSGKGIGLGLSILFIFLYYILFLSADIMVIKLNILPVIPAAWTANIVFLLLGFIYYHKKFN